MFGEQSGTFNSLWDQAARFETYGWGRSRIDRVEAIQRARKRRDKVLNKDRGTHEEFLRHVQEMAGKAGRMAREGRHGKVRHEFEGRMFEFMTDFRALLHAFTLVRADDPAPGADGIRYKEFYTEQWHDFIREASHQLRAGAYEFKPYRRCEIPKPGKQEKRSIAIPTALDRLVEKSALLVLGPYLDELFEDGSVGFRPGQNTENGLAQILWWAEKGNRPVMALADVRKAFDSVPHGPLMDIVRQLVPNPDVADLIGQIGCSPGRVRRDQDDIGIAAGGPLSPLLLNLYLDQVLDKPWAEEYPDQPIIRYADDVALPCKSKEEAECVLRQLEHHLPRHGLTVHPAKTEIHDLRILDPENPCVYLGFQPHIGDEGRPVVVIPSGAWINLKEALGNERRKSYIGDEWIADSWLRAYAPAYVPGKEWKWYRDRVLNFVQGLAWEYGATGIPYVGRLKDRWQREYAKWRNRKGRIYKRLDRLYTERHSAQGSQTESDPMWTVSRWAPPADSEARQGLRTSRAANLPGGATYRSWRPQEASDRSSGRRCRRSRWRRYGRPCQLVRKDNHVPEDPNVQQSLEAKAVAVDIPPQKRAIHSDGGESHHASDAHPRGPPTDEQLVE